MRPMGQIKVTASKSKARAKLIARTGESARSKMVSVSDILQKSSLLVK